MFCRKRLARSETDEIQLRKTSRVEPPINTEKGKGIAEKQGTLDGGVAKQRQCEHDPFWDIPGYQRDNGEFVLRCRRCGADL